jgi:anti-sigma factor RsiW
MCPDRQLLSVYLDGELPSPWKEKLEAHLAFCAECASQLEQFRECSSRLQEDVLDFVNAKDRVFQNLSPALSVPRPILWRRSISLPLPAAVAAAAIFVVAFIFALSRPFVPQAAPASVMASVDSEMESGVQNIIVPASDMTGILRYLGQQDGSEYMIITLPEGRNFISTGEPLIIKAADYTRGTGAR